MNCKQARNEIALLAGSDLDSAAAMALQTHLSVCPSCREHQAEIALSLDSLHSAAEVPWDAERDSLWPKLSVRLASEPVRRPERWNGLAPVLAVAAACVAMVWLSFGQGPVNQTSGNPNPPLQANTVNNRFVPQEDFRLPDDLGIDPRLLPPDVWGAQPAIQHDASIDNAGGIDAGLLFRLKRGSEGRPFGPGTFRD